MQAADPDDAKRLQWLQRMLPALRRDTVGHAGLLRLAAMQLWEESWNDKALMNLQGDEFAVAMERHYLGAVFHSLVAKRVGLVAASQQFDDVTRKVLREVLANELVSSNTENEHVGTGAGGRPASQCTAGVIASNTIKVTMLYPRRVRCSVALV